MSANQSVRSLYHLPDSLSDDLAELRELIDEHMAGRVSAEDLRAFRVPMGVYEQREPGKLMLRVRLPAGGVLPHQMRTLASVSRHYGNGILHLTTRQDIQVHRVPLESIHPALVELQAAGLATKGGCGDGVRNITACLDAGVCPHEAFDVSPYAIALTEHLLADPGSYQLPRKYKIAFSGCSRDCAGATVHDVGFIAKRRDGEMGFAVHVAGGLGASSRVADLLEEFIPAGDAYLVAEAVKRVFRKHGNRKDRRKARLRFLMGAIGLPRFRELYEAELADLRKHPPHAPELREMPVTARGAAPAAEPVAGFADWRLRNTVAQRQQGYFLVHIPLVLGDVGADALEKLADVVDAHGAGMTRGTQWQNLVIRWVREDELPALHAKLREVGLADTPAPVLRDAVSCTGASTCTLGICLSRGLAAAIVGELETSELDLQALSALKVHISGCPNSCSRHRVGDIGLCGTVRRHEGRPLPHYIIQLGGRVEEGHTRLAEGTTAIPARNVPAFLAEFLGAFQNSPQFPDFHAFVDADGREMAVRIAEDYVSVPSFDEDSSFYFDWGADEPFSLSGRGK